MHRTTEQVIDSAQAIDRAIAAGVDPILIEYMLECRKARFGERDWPPLTILAAIAAEPALKELDELLYVAIRRRVREAKQSAHKG